MVRVTEKGLVAKSCHKRNIYFFSLSECQNLGRIENPVKVIFSTLRGSLHIVAEMVSLSQREKEFWILSGILFKERKQCSPI